MWERLIALSTVLLFTACTTLQPLLGVSAETVSKNIQIGDRVGIVTVAQQVYELKVQQITEDAVFGLSTDRKSHRILLADIVSLEKKVVASNTTIWVVVSLLGLAALIAATSGRSGGSGGGEGY